MITNKKESLILYKWFIDNFSMDQLSKMSVTI